MIVDIPTTDDFKNSGIDFLNLAWEILIELLRDLKHAHEYFDSLEFEDIEFGDDTTITSITPFRHTISDEAYWKQAQRHLGTALSLIQQGTEFLLKGGIAEVSPFLLLDDFASNLPSGSQTKDISFSDFKTVNAQDLTKIYNAIVKIRLPDNFNDIFKNLRNKRNTIMHTVDPNLQINIRELVVELLEIYHYLIGQQSWVNIRKLYIGKAPESLLKEPDKYRIYNHEVLRLSSEIDIVVDLLKPSDNKKYFSFDKKRRRYICPQCLDGGLSWLHNKGYIQYIPKMAQLTSNKSDGVEVYCLICEQKSPVKRKDCKSEACKGNVIGGEYNTCLTCGSSG